MAKVKFDEKGWFIGQVVKTRICHEHDHDRLYIDISKITIQEYDKSKYTIHDHTTHTEDIEEILEPVPLSETKYKGKKFEEWNKIGSGALAIIGKSKKNNKIRIIKILIPK